MRGCRVLNTDEIDKLKASLPIRDRVFMMTGLYFGLRVSESLALTFGDVAGQYLQVRSAKGSNNTTFPIPPEYATEVESLRHDYNKRRGINPTANTPLFLAEKHMHVISRQAASQILRAACKTLGIDGKVNTHSYRKTMVTRVYELTGKDIVQVMVYSRHKNLGSLDSYIQTTADTGLVSKLKWTSEK